MIRFGEDLRLLALLSGLCAATMPALSKDDDGTGNSGARHQSRYDDRDRGHHGSEQFQIEVLSGRPDTIAGGDALVRITAHKKVDLNDVRVELNGAIVTGAFIADFEARTLTGLVTGMHPGENKLEVDVKKKSKGRADADIALINHPIEGPIISGPHEQPYFCETVNFNLVTGVSLGPPIDTNCSVVTRVDYMYRSTTGTFKPLGNLSSLPDDVATTTTLEGKTVAYVVRVETGTINRGVYEMSILHDPTTEPAPSFSHRPAGWNGRLMYTFGGGCGGGWYAQGTRTGGVMVHQLLSQGYAIASSTLNVYSQNCNDATSTEAQMMVKERFIENHGVPLFTMGIGLSASTYQMHSTVNIYPGILDGIVSAASFPDAMGPEQPDAVVLQRYWNVTAPGTFSEEQQRHVFGYRVWAAINNRAVAGRRNDPTALFRAVVPLNARYHPVDNPAGARATLPDHNVNIYGRDPATGFAFRTYDSVGVQYGLESLNAGVISKTQFLDLNEKVGGFDIDFNPTAERLKADPRGIRNVYRYGRMLDASWGIASTPIIDYRAYSDAQSNGDQHTRFHTFATRQRLIESNGNAHNQIIFTEDNRYGLFSYNSPVLMEAIAQMDHWLIRLVNDTSRVSKRIKVLRAKPRGLVDTCWSPDAVPVRIEEPASYDAPNVCNGYYPSFGTPRTVAGAPITNNVIKCRLKAIDMKDYNVVFTPAERARLAAVFADGVCDYTRRGVEQVKMKGTWLRF